MRWMIAALAAGLAGQAHAADITDPMWAKAPDRSDWAKAYPQDAAKTGAEGMARLRCTVNGLGALQDCSVLQESPSGAGFGAAALSLTSDFEIAGAGSQGVQPLAGKTVAFPMRFTPDLMHPGAIVTNPSWLKVPNGDDFGAYWPTAARGRSGRAVVHCVVTNRGLLDRCQVVSETPADAGYGPATLLITPSFLMRPMSVDGVPVGGGTINIPVNWQGPPPHASGRRMKIYAALPWSAAPTVADMAAAFPKGAIGRIDRAHVVLRCHVSDAGKLHDCDTLTEDPKDAGFANAARNLSKDFTAIVNPKVDTDLDSVVVNMPFDFRDPSKPLPPLQVMDPLWTQHLDPKAAVKLFPDAAAKAGYKTGLGLVDCQVTHAGSLIDCHVVEEDPPGFGFGDSALAIAEVMAMNPWTQQGSPVDGARIRIPVRLNLPDDSSPPAAPAKP